MRADRRRPALAGALALIVGAVLVPLIALDREPASAAQVAGDSGTFQATKKVYRKFQFKNSETGEITERFIDQEDTDGDGEGDKPREVTVKVDKTKELRGRERVHISWSGARPTSGRAPSPYGKGDEYGTALKQEYPVVIMQCRGREGDTANPLRPETCWTSTRQQRSEVAVSPTEALWRVDPYATEQERQRLTSSPARFPTSKQCPGSDLPGTGGYENSTHLTPFKSATGTTYLACNASTMPPEAAEDSSFPPAEMVAFTDFTGRGDVQFEVRSKAENESLGCSSTVPCSIVVIPIMGTSCMPKTSPDDPVNFVCRQDGRYANPGEPYNSKTDYDAAVSARYWWTASNWNNRISVPITFGPPPNVCELLDDRAPVGFYGSEMMAQASLQWAPAYCLNKSRFKYQGNKMPDDAAFDLLLKGGAPAAFVSRRRDSGTKSIGYAPTAITGFGVGYIIDKPENTGEFTDLRLTPRLLAKLLTTSYPAKAAGRDHSDELEDNPLNLAADPEFKALNPGLPDDLRSEAAAALGSLAVSSDVMWSLTSYLNRDPEARAFLDGKADPWGMRVNPSYKGIKLPVPDWPLNDAWRIEKPTSVCESENTTPYLVQLAAPVSHMRTIAESLLDGWPLVQTRADQVQDERGNDSCKYGRINRLPVGARFMVGIVDLGDAARLGLRTAALQTSATNSGAKFTDGKGRTFASATDEGMSAALGAYVPSGASSPFVFTPAKLTKTAYPGTAIVYTAAPLHGLDLAVAKNIASFLRISSTEGQVRGPGNGQLPDGYLPLLKTGATAALWKQTQTVADLVEKQTAPASATPTPTATATTDNDDDADSASTATSTPTATPGLAAAVEKATPQAGPMTTVIETDPSAVKTSSVAALLLPLLILGAAACMLATPILRMMLSQNDDQ